MGVKGNTKFPGLTSYYDHAETYMMDGNSSSYQKPKDWKNNLASGNPKFCDHDFASKYVQNDTLYIKCVVEKSSREE